MFVWNYFMPSLDYRQKVNNNNPTKHKARDWATNDMLKSAGYLEAAQEEGSYNYPPFLQAIELITMKHLLP
jgi:hypothetical protein